jgi:hypothetical protein
MGGLHIRMEWCGSGMMGEGGSGRGCSHYEMFSSSGSLSSLSSCVCLISSSAGRVGFFQGVSDVPVSMVI